MSDQGTLFDMGSPDQPPRQWHSETSSAAADEIAHDVSRLRRLVLDFLLAIGPDGATDEEMQSGIPMAPNTQRPRRIELVNQGLVKDSGQKRRTNSGRFAVVWIASGAV